LHAAVTPVSPVDNWARWDCPFGNADVNCDGSVDFCDINPFLLALFDPLAYHAAYQPRLTGPLPQS
jgi:hypothetical protein